MGKGPLKPTGQKKKLKPTAAGWLHSSYLENRILKNIYSMKESMWKYLKGRHPGDTEADLPKDRDIRGRMHDAYGKPSKKESKASRKGGRRGREPKTKGGTLSADSVL